MEKEDGANILWCISEINVFCGSKNKGIWSEPTLSGDGQGGVVCNQDASFSHHQNKVIQVVFSPYLSLSFYTSLDSLVYSAFLPLSPLALRGMPAPFPEEWMKGGPPPLGNGRQMELQVQEAKHLKASPLC